MDSALLVHRLHFAFTITFHYLFPQLTMGLALLIVVLKTIALRTERDTYNEAARFWARIFGINFVIGVVTGIPMEFQFGTNWSHFSRFAGGVIGQTLAMEGDVRLLSGIRLPRPVSVRREAAQPQSALVVAVAVFLGSWLSGFFIIATDAWMQHPVGYFVAADGSVQLTSFWELVLNPWAWWQYAHNMSGAVITGAFVMARSGRFICCGASSSSTAESSCASASSRHASPACFNFSHRRRPGQDDRPPPARHPRCHGGLFDGQPGAPLVIIGQPNVDERKIDNPIRRSKNVELPDLPALGRRGEGPGFVSSRPVAR